ncbi:MAG: hypothetical protein AAF741_18050 [Bacteroidota bacterium]
MSTKISPYFLLLLFCACNSTSNPYFPPKHSELSNWDYEAYTEILAESYDANDHFTSAFQLANLKADNTYIYASLEEAVKHQDGTCQKMYDIQHLADQGFYRHLYRNDTLRFREIFEMCLSKDGADAYRSFKAEKNAETEVYLSSRPPVDSSQLDHELIKKLEQIYIDDQYYRIEANKLDKTAEEVDSLWSLQLINDSLNLLRVDTILSEYGYPSYRNVGHEQAHTIFLVLHHIPVVELREKYFSLIKDKLDAGKIDLFMTRTETIQREEL